MPVPENPLPDGLPCFEPPKAPNSAGSVSFGRRKLKRAGNLIRLAESAS